MFLNYKGGLWVFGNGMVMPMGVFRYQQFASIQQHHGRHYCVTDTGQDTLESKAWTLTSVPLPCCQFSKRVPFACSKTSRILQQFARIIPTPTEYQLLSTTHRSTTSQQLLAHGTFVVLDFSKLL